jgi:hypothetical protein
VRETVAKSATSGGGNLERESRSLVALLHSAYLTTEHLTARPRVGQRQLKPASLPSKFLRPMPVWHKRMPRRSARS